MEYGEFLHLTTKTPSTMKKLPIVLLATLLLAFTSVSVSSITVTGTATDADSGESLPGVNVLVKGSSNGTVTDINGHFRLDSVSESATLIFSSVGYQTEEVKVNRQGTVNVALTAEVSSLSEVIVTGYGRSSKRSNRRESRSAAKVAADFAYPEGAPAHNTENYATIHENGFRDVKAHALSTFSIDVDAASYSNVRRFINQGQLPPKDAVRTEELVNYFTYDYPSPTGDTPFALYSELSICPWNEDHQLLHIGLQGKEIATQALPPSNLVFLIDVSGSMHDPHKLPLLKSAFRLLINQMRPEDRVAIVVYAGAAGLVLPPTLGSDKPAMLAALEQLQAGGSTAGGEGIRLAYQVAQENFQPEGNNRIILATDGDFNVGTSSDAAMERLVEEKRAGGVFLTVLGFGMGNYQDAKMELLADRGNGNYAYIDNLSEARKVLVSEFGGTMFTIAKDVKLQVEFNPALVKAYRLIGYENRLLNDEDFNDDRKDAGELGVGHTVTAMYELIPAGSPEGVPSTDALKYQQREINEQAHVSDELLTLKLRYKEPSGKASRRIEEVLKGAPVAIGQTSDNFRYAAAVAGFGMLLRDSEYRGNFTFDKVAQMAKQAKGQDVEGYRQEFIGMVESCSLLASN